MAQAIVDPEQLRRFAAMLRHFNHEMSDGAAKLNQQMGELASTWRDQEHRKFATEFAEQMKLISKLVENAEKHIPYLMRKAELIEEYLRQ
jgi:uncharacterized protein YukE